MKRHFLVVGTGPLLAPGAREFSGQCLRTWHFARPLLSAGHEVTLATIPIPGATPAGSLAVSEDREYEGQRYESFLANDPARVVPRLRQKLAAGGVDAVVGINAYPAYLLALCEPSLPFWADLNGWTMAEGQTRAAVVGHDNDLEHFWQMEALTLLHADRLSAVSERQADALMGELAILGRLTRLNFRTPLASAVPNAIYPDFARLARGGTRPASLAALSPDAHLLLWSGGFNTWTDVPTLVDGLARALAADPDLHFVVTGGAVTGHDDLTFRRFQDARAGSLPADRVHVLGWVDAGEVVALHACCHVGLNLDSPNTETRFGARNRLTNMLGAGLPVITTRGTEIARWIEENRAGEVIPSGSGEALAEAILRSHRDRGEWEARACRAREAAQHSFAPEATLGDFLRWAAHPCRAEDRLAGTPPPFASRIRQWVAWRGDVTSLLAEREGLLHDRECLERLRAKWPVALWRKIKALGRNP